MMRIRWRQVALFCVAVMTLILYNEWLAYYFVLLQCQWPSLEAFTSNVDFVASNSAPLRVQILADTHLLGSRDGHWFDKLRR